MVTREICDALSVPRLLEAQLPYLWNRVCDSNCSLKKKTWCIKEPLWCLLRIHSNVSNVDYLCYSIEVVLWFPFSLLPVGEWLGSYLVMCVSFLWFSSLSAYFINECWFTVPTDMVASTIWQWTKRVCLWTSIILGTIQCIWYDFPTKKAVWNFTLTFIWGMVSI